jgi:hypothetical protein
MKSFHLLLLSIALGCIVFTPDVVYAVGAQEIAIEDDADDVGPLGAYEELEMSEQEPVEGTMSAPERIEYVEQEAVAEEPFEEEQEQPKKSKFKHRKKPVEREPKKKTKGKKGHVPAREQDELLAQEEVIAEEAPLAVEPVIEDEFEQEQEIEQPKKGKRKRTQEATEHTPKKEKKAKKEKEPKKKKPAKEEAAPKVILAEDITRNKQIMDEVYANISGFGQLGDGEENKVIDQGGAPTYGEITYDSLQTLINDLDFGPQDIFVDLGSGVGKVVTQVYLNTPVKEALGYELADTRYNGALQARQMLEDRGMIEKGRKIAFFNDNMLNAKLKGKVKGNGKFVVYTCSTCFSPELMHGIGQMLSKLKPGLIFMSLKPLTNYANYGFKLLKIYNLPMTWAANGNDVNVYELVK